MEAKLGKAGKQAFRIANLLDDAADAIRKRSKRAYREGQIGLDEYMEARAKELELRSELSVIVGTDLGATLQEAAEAGENITHAIRDATSRIVAVRSLETGLKIVSTLVSLAGALVSGNLNRIISAGKAVARDI